MTKTISLSARRLSIRLGLGDLVSRPNCKGYQNCCACPECMVVANLILEHQAAGRHAFTPDGKLATKPQPRQPWAA